MSRSYSYCSESHKIIATYFVVVDDINVRAECVYTDNQCRDVRQFVVNQVACQLLCYAVL